LQQIKSVKIIQQLISNQLQAVEVPTKRTDEPQAQITEPEVQVSFNRTKFQIT
jgi:hypothetical protein